MTNPHQTDAAAPEASQRGWLSLLLRSAGILGMALTGLLAALALTPAASVTVFGQQVEVGAVAPSSLQGWAGPGQAELFGAGAVETIQTFEGPIRPRIVWQEFNRDAAASAFLQPNADDGRRVISTDTSAIGEALARGWIQFFLDLVLASILFAALAYLVVIAAEGIVRGPRATHPRARHRIWPLAATCVVAAVLTTASAALTVSSARDQLAGVASLADLTGSAPLVPAPSAAGPPRADVEIAVIGDSTAAGVGNDPMRDPTDADIACQRSQDAYAEVLQAATGRTVENLGCASATISDGLLTAQSGRRPVTPPPQVGVLKTLTSLRMVIVSIGANDIGWADFLKYCYGLPRCDDQVSQSLIRSRLDTFGLQYAQLLQQLSTLPTQPTVIVTGYYDPFGDEFGCSALADPLAPVPPAPGYGFGPDPGEDDPAAKVATKIDPMRSVLAQLNLVLELGADAFGFSRVQPTFEGHTLCSTQPWVQGLSDPHPFHPNAAGELAIAATLLPQVVSVLPS
ncbi:MAG: GDSL-type esterase/lipase family protein [Candidatus Nanopelagicales bacterium]